MRTRTTAALTIAAAALAAIALTAAPAAADDTDDPQIRYAARYGSWMQETGGSHDSATAKPRRSSSTSRATSSRTTACTWRGGGDPAWLGVWRGTDLNDVIVVTVEPDHSGDTAWPYYDYLVDGGGGNDTICVYSRGSRSREAPSSRGSGCQVATGTTGCGAATPRTTATTGGDRVAGPLAF